MELALIPPKSLMADTNRTRMQLVLPQLLKYKPEDNLDDYSLRYRKHCDDPHQYVIMDNGAAEAEQISSTQLLRIAELYAPDELAIPDTLANSEATILQAWDFFGKNQRTLDKINADRYKSGLVDLKLGFVAQGRSVDESVNCVIQMLSHHWSSQVKVIYIPRLLVRESSDHLARIKVWKTLHRSLGAQFEYHFFGAAPSWPNEVNVIRDYEGIRSIDTSLPYTMAHYVADINSSYKREGLNRPVGYFERPIDNFPDSDHYVNYFLGI